MENKHLGPGEYVLDLPYAPAGVWFSRLKARDVVFHIREARSGELDETDEGDEIDARVVLYGEKIMEFVEAVQREAFAAGLSANRKL